MTNQSGLNSESDLKYTLYINALPYLFHMFTNKAVVILGVFGKHSHPITMQVYSRMGPIQKPTHRSIYVCMYIQSLNLLATYVLTKVHTYTRVHMCT